MKTKINILFLSLLTLTVFILVSCDDDGDTTLPVINLIAPAEGAVLKIGSSIHFDMELSDNEMLSAYKVVIHHNFDGHGHSRVSETETKTFDYHGSWDISGQKNAKIYHHEIEIPDSATPGNYHFMVYCTDAAGNESYVVRNVLLSEDGEEHDHDN